MPHGQRVSSAARQPQPRTRPTHPRRVYSVVGVPPEIQAYALAKYSRSSQGMLESIRELSAQKAEQFLNTFYFQYGHRSIADLAHLVFGLEQISILAAIAVVDEPVWDGQERSTRYQPFRKTGWHLPERSRRHAGRGDLRPDRRRPVRGLRRALTRALLEHLDGSGAAAGGHESRRLPAHPARAGLRRGALAAAAGDPHQRRPDRAARACSSDRSAGCSGSPYAEVRAVGAELKASCQAPAEAPLSTEPQPPPRRRWSSTPRRPDYPARSRAAS